MKVKCIFRTTTKKMPVTRSGQETPIVELRVRRRRKRKMATKTAKRTRRTGTTTTTMIG